MAPYNQQVGLKLTCSRRNDDPGRSGIDEHLCCGSHCFLERFHAQVCLSRSVVGEFFPQMPSCSESVACATGVRYPQTGLKLTGQPSGRFQDVPAGFGEVD